MRDYNPKSQNINARQVIKVWSILLLILLSSCVNSKEGENPTEFVGSRGSNLPVQNIVWSPVDENKILVSAYETPLQPAEIYLLNIQTGEKEFLVGPVVNAQFIETKWMPSGNKVLILAVDTSGFEPSGWWLVDVETKSAEYIMDPVDAIAWSPNGEFIAVLQREPKNNTSSIQLKLIDANTKAEELIATYDMDYSAGLSWSPDGRYVVFSLGEYQVSSNLSILAIETREVTTLTTQNNRSEYPTWSPKGNIIAFVADKYLHLINLDKTCEIEIPNLEDIWSPTWSPDGKELGFLDRDGIHFLDINKTLGRDIYQNFCER